MRSTNRHDIPIIAGVIYIPSFPETSEGKGRRKVRLQIESRDPSAVFSTTGRVPDWEQEEPRGTGWNRTRIGRVPSWNTYLHELLRTAGHPARTRGGSQVVEKPGNHVDPNGSLSFSLPLLSFVPYRLEMCSTVPSFEWNTLLAFHSGSLLIITLLIRTPFHRAGKTGTPK